MAITNAIDPSASARAKSPATADPFDHETTMSQTTTDAEALNHTVATGAREQLPEAARVVTDWLPLTAAVELVRPLLLGQWPEQPWRWAAVLAAYAVVGLWVALAFTRQRFRR